MGSSRRSLLLWKDQQVIGKEHHEWEGRTIPRSVKCLWWTRFRLLATFLPRVHILILSRHWSAQMPQWSMLNKNSFLKYCDGGWGLRSQGAYPVVPWVQTWSSWKNEDITSGMGIILRASKISDVAEGRTSIQLASLFNLSNPGGYYAQIYKWTRRQKYEQSEWLLRSQRLGVVPKPLILLLLFVFDMAFNIKVKQKLNPL